MIKLNFRKIIKIGKHIQLNINNKGISSATIKAGRLSYNTKTKKARFNLGKGLYYIFGKKN